MVKTVLGRLGSRLSRAGSRPACQSCACTTSARQSGARCPSRQCRRGAAKQRKAGRVVRPVLPVDVLVGVAAALEGRRLDQVNRQLTVAIGRQFALQQGKRCPVQGAAGNRARRGQGRQGGRVGRQHQPRIDADGAQCGGQGADHVAQAAGLDEWIGLAGRQQNPQAPAHGSSSTSAASGGRSSVIDHGRLIHGMAWAWAPLLPTLLPP